MESPTFHTQDDRQLYQVLHSPEEQPKAGVLLVGPFPTERPYSYAAWARWARFLAGRGFTVLRFDFRAVGESTGHFEDVTLGDWIDDSICCFGSLSSKLRGLPIALHGLGTGGLIAAQVFKRGSGDALLTWSAPSNGIEAVKDAFSRRLMMDFVTQGANRRKWEDYVRDLEANIAINVLGYPITGRMWKEAAQYMLHPSGSQPHLGPTKHVKLGRDAAPLIAGLGQWRALNPALQTGYVPLNPDFNKLFVETAEWLESSLAVSRESCAQ